MVQDMIQYHRIIKVLVVNFLTVCFALIISSCVSVQPVPPNTATITLDKPYATKAKDLMMRTILFPSGTYTPEFQTEKGVYYLAPTSVIYDGHPFRGGLFVPRTSNESQAYWVDGLQNNPVFPINGRVPYN